VQPTTYKGSMHRKLRFLVSVLSPLAYLAAVCAVYVIAQMVAYVISIDRRTFERLADKPGAVEVLVSGVALAVFAAATLVLVKLEGRRRPSIWDHVRQSVLWYAFGLSWWLTILGKAQRPSVTDTIVGLIPLAAILANGLVLYLVRRRQSEPRIAKERRRPHRLPDDELEVDITTDGAGGVIVTVTHLPTQLYATESGQTRELAERRAQDKLAAIFARTSRLRKQA
jgi:hypothetical protein